MSKTNIPNRSLLVILVLIVALMIALNPQRFPTLSNVISMAYQLPILAFLSLAMMMAMLSGGINLAIVSTANLVGIVTALTLSSLTGGASAEAGIGTVMLAMLVGLAAGFAVGAVNGFLIAFLEIPSILTTLGMMTLLDGINIVMTRGYTISGFPGSLITIGNGAIAGVPVPFLLLIVAVLILAVVLKRTAFGFSLYMMGSNYRATSFSNIDNRSIILREYLLSAFFSALTAFIMMGQLNSVKANYAESFLLVAVLACFLGGIDPFGGVGTVSGMVLSVVILQVISTGVNLLRLDPFFIRSMWGFIIIIVIAVNHFAGRMRERRQLQRLSGGG
ncbi:MAG: ABC transporter permease [bacterium]